MRANSRPSINFVGLIFTADPSALIGSVLLWLILSAVGLFVLNFSLPKALTLALAAVALHWIGDILHQFGHTWAARSAGHPMIGIRLWGVLSSSIYPADEPKLPKAVHIRRVLGGPIISLVITLLALLLLSLFVSGSWLWWLTLFFFLDNLLVFSVGAFLPLGFTDGSTLLRLARTQD